MKVVVHRFIERQAIRLLAQRNYAVFLAVMFALLPYTTWLSLAIIALVTQRKGWQEGIMVLMPAVIAHVCLSLLSTPLIITMINVALVWLLTFLAAFILRASMRWNVVAATLFMVALGASVAIQVCMPQFVTMQYVYLQALIRNVQPNNPLLQYLSDADATHQTVYANYLFGIQLMGIAISACLPVFVARSVQSRLFYVGGFRHEMLTFRAEKVGVLLFLVFLIAAYFTNPVAINAVPLLFCYLALAGFSLSINALQKKKLLYILLLMLFPILFLPFVALPMYAVLGMLDSLFNFRVYLSSVQSR